MSRHSCNFVGCINEPTTRITYQRLAYQVDSRLLRWWVVRWLLMLASRQVFYACPTHLNQVLQELGIVAKARLTMCSETTVSEQS